MSASGQQHGETASSQAASSHAAGASGHDGDSRDQKNKCVFGVPERRAREIGADMLANCSVILKVGIVGDAQIGKTSLMVRYVENVFDELYIQTLGGCPTQSPPKYLAD